MTFGRYHSRKYDFRSPHALTEPDTPNTKCEMFVGKGGGGGDGDGDEGGAFSNLLMGKMHLYEDSELWYMKKMYIKKIAIAKILHRFNLVEI